jgi:hypothetical protein
LGNGLKPAKTTKDWIDRYIGLMYRYPLAATMGASGGDKSLILVMLDTSEPLYVIEQVICHVPEAIPSMSKGNESKV